MSLSTFLVILHLTYVSMRPTVYQPVGTEWVPIGDSVTFECSSITSILVTWMWLKHTPGKGLAPIVTTYYGKVMYQGYFKNTSRFELQTDNVSFNLTIRNVALSDVGSYHCGIFWYNDYYFGNGAYLKIQANESTEVNSTKRDIQENQVGLMNNITFVLVVTIAILLITNILPIILWRRALQKGVAIDISPTAQNLNMGTENYAALSFSSKRSEHGNGRGHGGDAPRTTVVYAPIKQQRTSGLE